MKFDTNNWLTKTKYWFCAGFLLLSTSTVAQELLTIENAISTALQNNYNIKISKLSQEVAANNAEFMNAGFMPSVDLQFNKNWSNQNVKQEFLDGRLNTRDGAKSQNFGSSANLSWTLFDGLGMFYQLDRLENLQNASVLATKVSIENVLADVLVAYYTVTLQNERLLVLKNSIVLSEKRVEIAKNKYEVGKASKIEFLAAQVDFNTDQTQLLQEDELYKNAKVDLNRLLGRSLSVDFSPTESIEIINYLQLEELLNTANVQNPNLLLAQRNMNIAYLQTQQIRAERYPVINFNSGYSFNTASSEAGFLASNRQNGYNYGFTARINVFDGFSINRRTQNAKLNVQQSELQIKDLTQSIESDIIKTFTSYQNNINLIALEKQNLDVAKENEEIALERYRLGNTTSLELREAQINLVQAQSRLLNAQYRTKISEIELLRLSGNILRASERE
jgi:outer membrane protein TolC